MKKEYFNQEAYDYISSQLNKTKIKSVFKPIVIDIILRRRHEYQLDDKYFHRDVESFVNNVKDIYLKNLPKRIGGRFYADKKCIGINQNGFKENMNDEQYMEYVLEIISHECGHAMNYDETGNDRVFPREEVIIDDAGTLVDAIGIQENFNEKEADRIIRNRKLEDASKYHNETIGYSRSTMFVNAIAAAFGIKEKELLAAAIKGKQELYEVLNTNIKYENFSKEIFEDICFNINLAHIELYKEDKSKENIWNSLNFVYRDMEQILAYRIESLEWDNIEDLQEKLEDIKLSQNAISSIMEGAIIESLGEETDKEFLAIPGKTMVYTKVMCMEEIIKTKGENSRELISFVQNSENVDGIMEFMKQNGIEINSVNIALMPEFELSQQKRDEWAKEFCLDGEEWDNTEIITYMMENKEKIMKAKEKVSLVDIFNRIYGVCGKVFAPLIFPAEYFEKACKKLWKTLHKKEQPLLLGERRRRKNRRQKVMGFI